MKIGAKQQIILNKGDVMGPAYTRLCRAIETLANDKAWVITIEEKKLRRTTSQNSLLWALYDDIIKLGGEAMRGWNKDDLHTFFLIEHFGSETISFFGKKKLVPLRRSSKLNKQDFTDFITHIVDFMAGQGVHLELPNHMNGGAW